jgi:hypothetical protein
MKRIIVWCMAMVLAGALLLPLQAGAETEKQQDKDDLIIIITPPINPPIIIPPISPTISPIVKPPKPDCRDYPTCLQHSVCITDSRCKPKALPCNVPCWNYPACLKCASCEGDPQCRPPKKLKTPQIKVPKPTEGVIIVVPGQVEKVEKKEKKYKEVVKVKGKSNTQGHFVHRGSSWDFPILPVRTFTIPGRPGGPARNGFVLQMRAVKMVLIIIDPVIAVGYDYFVDKGPKVTEIELPEGIGDNLYELWLFDNGANDFVNTGVTIVGGEPYTLSEPVDKFSIRGIEVDAGLDPEDELAFPTGLKFVDSGEVEMRMISITVDTDQE